jgi:tetratricopeptide (TPR) repeat protein
MICKKIHFPIFILLIIFTTTYLSCNDSQNKEIYYEDQYDTLVSRGFTFYGNQNFDSAFYYFYKAKEVCKNSEKDRIAYALYFIAEMQSKQSDFIESEATATEIIKLHPKYNSINDIYNLLGLNYIELYDFENALKYFNLAINSVTSEKDKLVYFNNIGYNYLEAKEFLKAQQLLSEVIAHDSLAINAESHADVLDNLGYAYFKLNDPKAINYLKESLQIRDSLENNSELIASYMHLSEYYLNSNPTLAQDFAQKAYNSATAINSPDDRIEALKFQITSGISNDVKKLALKQMSISDSINKIRQASKTQFAKFKFDNYIALKESEKQKTQKQLYLLLFLFASTIFLVIFFTIRSRNRRKLRTISYETETRISKRLHDELANDVFNALTYAETQDLQDNAKKEQLLENLDAIYTRTRNIAKENSDIDTGSNFQDNLQSMIASYISNDVNVLIQNQNTINWLSVKKEVKIAIYRTLQELLVNMKKHSQCSVVVIRFENTKKEIIINYSDNGIGTSEMLKFKNGLQNAENRILAIKGTLTFETESGKGFKAQIIVPE